LLTREAGRRLGLSQSCIPANWYHLVALNSKLEDLLGMGVRGRGGMLAKRSSEETGATNQDDTDD
jgi:hypothetical protein